MATRALGGHDQGPRIVNATLKPSSRRRRPIANQLRWAWQRHWGLPALLALMALTLAAWVQWQWQPVLRAEQSALQQRQRQRIELPKLNDPTLDPERASLRWIEALPGTELRGEQVRTLIDAAARSGVTLERADYAVQADGALPISRLAVTVPVNGSYAAVRRFVATVLNDLPNAALESLQLERNDTQSSQLRTTARLLLLYRSEPR